MTTNGHAGKPTRKGKAREEHTPVVTITTSTTRVYYPSTHYSLPITDASPSRGPPNSRLSVPSRLSSSHDGFIKRACIRTIIGTDPLATTNPLPADGRGQRSMSCPGRHSTGIGDVNLDYRYKRRAGSEARFEIYCPNERVCSS